MKFCKNLDSNEANKSLSPLGIPLTPHKCKESKCNFKCEDRI